MARQWRHLGWVAGVMAYALGCSGPEVPYADGRIAATVMGTRPIAGAEVRIWEVFQGERSAEPVATAGCPHDVAVSPSPLPRDTRRSRPARARR